MTMGAHHRDHLQPSARLPFCCALPSLPFDRPGARNWTDQGPNGEENEPAGRLGPPWSKHALVDFGRAATCCGKRAVIWGWGRGVSGEMAVSKWQCLAGGGASAGAPIKIFFRPVYPRTNPDVYLWERSHTAVSQLYQTKYIKSGYNIMIVIPIGL